MADWAASRPSVELVGQLGSDRCAELIARARAVMLPSAWEETFGLVAVEAMAAGTAPIAAGHGSFTELITPGVDGVLFRPGDPAALAAVLADADENPEQYETYGDQARKSYEQRFDPQPEPRATGRDLPVRDRPSGLTHDSADPQSQAVEHAAFASRRDPYLRRIRAGWHLGLLVPWRVCVITRLPRGMHLVRLVIAVGSTGFRRAAADRRPASHATPPTRGLR